MAWLSLGTSRSLPHTGAVVRAMARLADATAAITAVKIQVGDTVMTWKVCYRE